eukprot:132504-Hanusia_phi.AAC.2
MDDLSSASHRRVTESEVSGDPLSPIQTHSESRSDTSQVQVPESGVRPPKAAGRLHCFAYSAIMIIAAGTVRLVCFPWHSFGLGASWRRAAINGLGPAGAADRVPQPGSERPPPMMAEPLSGLSAQWVKLGLSTVSLSLSVLLSLGPARCP